MHLAARLHAQRHYVSILAVEAERAHCSIDADTARTNTIGVCRTLLTADLFCKWAHCGIGAIIALVMA